MTILAKEETKLKLIAAIIRGEHFSGNLNLTDAATLGYIINRIMSSKVDEDDKKTIYYEGFKRRNNAQCQADKYLYYLYASFNTGTLCSGTINREEGLCQEKQ